MKNIYTWTQLSNKASKQKIKQNKYALFPT